jgi:hypothetical protein
MAPRSPAHSNSTTEKEFADGVEPFPTQRDTTTLGIVISSSTAAPPSEHIPLWWRCCFFAAWSD